MDLERRYSTTPAQLLALLLSDLRDMGRVESVSSYGSEVTFALKASLIEVAPTLTARVEAWDGGALVRVWRARPEEWVDLHDDHHMQHLMELLGRMEEAVRNDS